MSSPELVLMGFWFQVSLAPDPWRRKWQPTPLFLKGKPYGERRLGGYSPWGRKELDMTERAHTII